ncbi:cbb3-type cytochrome oxidase subunit 3 [Zavarzinia compransoris]|uniref:CcoQ/FixQ family Cbb3-type cytochrome c oxidase assembly chaperone n=1 Tax=Zavarzinia compransoris TaxID=1264899 RepID=A0A317E176_9PROT|nr:cbb3-type cytochrome c oxidase subunit 3 [Zavarzinia compransoris]PWR20818.1 hypothetical protein DKG75_12565 [Zavarzinia compransoris]TDP44346.1 cbb3-type cytochrome oxidase subunit 3 [Zavarzinia compransoris]
MDYESALVWSRIAGLLIFFGLFLGFVGWSYRPGSRRYYQEAAELPFKASSDDGREN